MQESYQLLQSDNNSRLKSRKTLNEVFIARTAVTRFNYQCEFKFTSLR